MGGRPIVDNNNGTFTVGAEKYWPQGQGVLVRSNSEFGFNFSAHLPDYHIQDLKFGGVLCRPPSGVTIEGYEITPPTAPVAGASSHAGVAGPSAHAGVAGPSAHAGVAGPSAHAGVAGASAHAGVALPSEATPVEVVALPALAVPNVSGPSGPAGFAGFAGPSGPNISEPVVTAVHVFVRPKIVGIKNLTHGDSGDTVNRTPNVAQVKRDSGLSTLMLGNLTLGDDTGFCYKRWVGGNETQGDIIYRKAMQAYNSKNLDAQYYIRLMVPTEQDIVNSCGVSATSDMVHSLINDYRMDVLAVDYSEIQATSSQVEEYTNMLINMKREVSPLSVALILPTENLELTPLSKSLINKFKAESSGIYEYIVNCHSDVVIPVADQKHNVTSCMENAIEFMKMTYDNLTEDQVKGMMRLSVRFEGME